MKAKLPESFVITQLEEALEERQKPDRREKNKGYDPKSFTDRRKGDRRGPGKKRTP